MVLFLKSFLKTHVFCGVRVAVDEYSEEWRPEDLEILPCKSGLTGDDHGRLALCVCVFACRQHGATWKDVLSRDKDV